VTDWRPCAWYLTVVLASWALPQPSPLASVSTVNIPLKVLGKMRNSLVLLLAPSCGSLEVRFRCLVVAGSRQNRQGSWKVKREKGYDR